MVCGCVRITDRASSVNAFFREIGEFRKFTLSLFEIPTSYGHQKPLNGIIVAFQCGPVCVTALSRQRVVNIGQLDAGGSGARKLSTNTADRLRIAGPASLQ